MEVQKYALVTRVLAGYMEAEKVWQILMRRDKGGCLRMDARVRKTKTYCHFVKRSQNTGKNTPEKTFRIGETSMRTATRFIALAFVLVSCRSNASGWPDSCVGNFCMNNPPGEKEFIARYGGGVFRRDVHDQELHYRCFYDATTKQWAEFQFSRHGDREPRHLEEVAIGQTELCRSHYRSRRPMNLKIAKGAISIGMTAKDITEKLGPPSRIVPLTPSAKNDIYDSKFGDFAWIYATDEKILLVAIYIKDSKMVNFRLSFGE
jgi:hypothetical protein